MRAPTKADIDHMTCADVSGVCLEAWKGSPIFAAAATGLVAAVIESPSARHHVRPRIATVLAVVAASLFIACGVLAAEALTLTGVVTLAGALTASAGALWFFRVTPDGTGGNDGGGGRGPDGRPIAPCPADGIDWDAFETDFAAYAERHALVH